MERKIPVFQTLSDAFALMAERKHDFFNALLIPTIILIAVQIILFFQIGETHITLAQLTDMSSLSDLSPWEAVGDLATLMLFAWMMNVSSRIAITHTAGHKGWASAETWTAIWLLALTFLITVLSMIPAVFIGLFLMLFSPILAIPCAAVTFLIFHLYLFARFILVFPATAMGDKASFREAWDLSRGNGWRLMALFALVPIGFSLASALLGILLPVRIFIIILGILLVIFSLAGVIAISLAYKQLKA